MRQIKSYCFYYLNGKDLKEEFDLQLTNAVFIEKACKLFLKTNFLSEETRLYLREPSLSFEDVSILSDINLNTLKSRFRSENIKIERILGEFFQEILKGGELSYKSLNRASALIDFNIKKYGMLKTNMNDYLAYPIEKVTSNEYEGIELDEESFNILKRELAEISLAFLKIKVETMSSDFKRYFNKLNKSDVLNEKDLARKEIILSILNR